MNDLEIHDNEDRDAYIKNLERRVRYCESVAQNYEMMFKQLQSEMRAIADRQGNIQQVYDYLTRVGSSIAIKQPHEKKFLNPITKALPKDSQKYLEALRTFKFKVGDEVFYANESFNKVSRETISGIDVIDKHPRYCFEGILGYIDESKLFHTEERARDQLDEWKRSADGSRYC